MAQFRKSITEKDHAIDLFTDRNDLIRRFMTAVHDDEGPQPVLCFHGEGGNGKSLLLTYLRERCCKRIADQNWNFVKELPNEQSRQHIEQAEGALDLPVAMLDFAAPSEGGAQPQEAFSGLMAMRQQLAGHELRFPLFHYAYLRHLELEGRLTKDNVRRLFPTEEFELAIELFEFFKDASIPIASAVVGVIEKHLGRKITMSLAARKIGERELMQIRTMDESSLLDQLPVLFAQDLAAIMKHPDASPIALLFDAHDAFWKGRFLDSDEDRLKRDTWLLRLLYGLQGVPKIVKVVSGRTPPRWQAYPMDWDEPIELEECPVDEFIEADAREYLKKALDGTGTDAELLDALLAYSSVRHDGELRYHPLMLGFCADVVIHACEKGLILHGSDFPEEPRLEVKKEQLLNLLLSYVDLATRDAIYALSACRTFDFDIYRSLGRVLDFSPTRSVFGEITRFSFIRPTLQSEDQYRIHDLVRRLSLEKGGETIKEAHEALINYFKGKADSDPVALAHWIYHVNQVRPEEGIHLWIAHFEKATKRSRYLENEALLEIAGEIRVSGALVAHIHAQIGDYFLTFSRMGPARSMFEHSLRVYSQMSGDDSATHNNRGNVLQSLGDLHAVQSRHTEAREAYRKSIASYDGALALAPDFVEAHNNRGVVLQRLGDFHAVKSRHDEALGAYKESITSHDRALVLAPENAQIHNNRGNVLQRVGSLHSVTSRHVEAQEAYGESTASYNRALALAPDDVATYNNRGNVLQLLGDLHAVKSRYVKAQDAYRESIDCFDRALKLAPDHALMHSNRGAVFQSLGELHAGQSRHGEAQDAYGKSVASYDRALKLAPDMVKAHINRGNLLHRLGDLHEVQSRHGEAQDAYRESIASYDRALALSPDYAAAHSSRGAVLQSLGDLHARQSRYVEAQKAYRESITSSDRALKHAPDMVMAHNYRGRVFRCLGDLHAVQSCQGEAQDAYRESTASYDCALKLAPDNVAAHNDRGRVFQRLGNLLAGQSRPAEAVEAYRESTASYDRALKLAPDDVAAHNNRGNVLHRLGELHAVQSRPAEAHEAYGESIASYDRVLAVAPSDDGMHVNRGLTQLKLAWLLDTTQKAEAAIQHVRDAIRSFDRAREVNPLNQDAAKLREIAVNISQRLGDADFPSADAPEAP